MNSVLVVDDEAKIRRNLCEILRLKGFKSVEASGGAEAVKLFAESRPAAVLLDLTMPGMDGMETLKQLRGIDPIVPVIIVTAHSDIPSAVNAVKLGAYDFLSKPPDFDYLIITLNRAIETLALQRKVLELDTALNTSLESVLGRSPSMQKVIKQLQRIAASDYAVLIQGETGTGKTYLADVIHSLSKRAGKPFVKVSIGSLQDSVVESELFGYEKGAFTGAERTKKGYFETADGGTLFIDDLDNISGVVQGKLLNIIEEKQVFRVGNPVPIDLNLRIIGATNADLLRCVAEGKFREDLFFRLTEVTLNIPPLRERFEDIAFFASKFFSEACAELDNRISLLSEEVIDRLGQYSWPGNLRQLKNIMKRAALRALDDKITPKDMEILIGASSEREDLISEDSPFMTIKDAEKIAIQKAITFTKGQKLKAASILQIDYKTLVRKMKDYNIE